MQSAESTRAAKGSAAKRVLHDPVSRRKFMALTGGTASLSVLVAACGDDNGSSSNSTTSNSSSDSDVLTQFGEGDLGIVNYALTLEYLEADFYEQVVASGLFKGDDLALIEEIGKNEQEHVAGLTAFAKQLGGEPAPKPKTMFDTSDAATVLQTAADVENLGAAAYLGQAAAIKDPAVLAAALSIHTVEGRHASALNTLTDQPITPDGPFAVPADAQTVLDTVKPFIVS